MAESSPENGLYFLSLELNKVACFGEKAIIDLSNNASWQKWTIILGENGTGKTTLLQLLSGFEMVESFINDQIQFSPKGIPEKPSNMVLEQPKDQEALGKVVATLGNSHGKVETTEKVELLMFGYNCLGTGTHLETFLAGFQCYGYGANRLIGNSTLQESLGSNTESLFYEYATLINAEEWLLQLDYTANVPSEVQQIATRKRDTIKEVLKQLLTGIDDIRFSPPTLAKMLPTVEFHTHLGWATLQQISLGYKSMLAWIVDFAYRMFERYPLAENPLAEPAVVLIDEIDLHLHPKWQREIFSFLNDIFPATQFIVTAHSPLIVQAAPENANIILLKKDGDHITIDQNKTAIQQWRVDQILSSELFNIPQRNVDIEAKLERRKILQARESPSLSELTELKQLNTFVHSLPQAEAMEDIEARAIIQKAAAIIKERTASSGNDPVNS